MYWIWLNDFFLIILGKDKIGDFSMSTVLSLNTLSACRQYLTELKCFKFLAKLIIKLNWLDVWKLYEYGHIFLLYM